MASGGNAGGYGSEGEGEEQEDPSSSLYAEHLNNAVAGIKIEEEEDEEEDELSVFRQQWQRELEASPLKTPQKRQNVAQNLQDDAEREPPSDFERAQSYFMLAVQLENAGCWYDSVQNYKRAIAIVPNIELLLYQQGLLDTQEDDVIEEEVAPVEPRGENDDEEEMVEGEDLLTRIKRIQGRKGVLCEPATPLQGMHISWLPYEVLLLIARWVVSSELDAASLERLGTASRGLYLLARDHDIWRNICIRTWGIECGTPRIHGFGSWRQMYLDRPRLQLHGCYISQASYLRHGESSYQEQGYRPWFLVQYYRYLRFFPDGLVLMLTSPEEPSASVGLLRSRHAKLGQGLMAGHYRLRGDRVIIVMKKNSDKEKKSSQATNTRFRSRRRDPDPQEREQTFHIELQLSSPSGRRNMRLSWRGYSVCVRHDQWTEFELCPAKFPAFAFSRVRHYTRDAAAPLATHPIAALKL